MKILLFTAVSLVILLLGFGIYVRLAPSDAARWHVDPASADAPPGGSFRTDQLVDLTPADALAAFDAVALASPRTRLLAGTVAEGRMTFVSRSRVGGFPDYITVSAEPAPGGSQLHVLARLRFGSGDLGTNKARVIAWLKAMKPVQR